MRYIRVILAVKEEDMPRAEAALEMMIETDNVVDDFPFMGVQGAHKSTWYESREDAVSGTWLESDWQPWSEEFSNRVMEEGRKLDDELAYFYRQVWSPE